MDYAEPDGRQAAIALIRKPAAVSEGYRGPVLLNPGGPGDSGVNMILLPPTNYPPFSDPSLTSFHSTPEVHPPVTTPHRIAVY